MKAVRTDWAGLVMLVCLWSGQVSAQILCQDAVVVGCGQTISGDSTGGGNRIEDYACIRYRESGPESVFQITLEQDTRLSVSLIPQAFDAAIAILPQAEGDCVPEACAAGSDSSMTGTESALADLPAGTYNLVVDGYNGAAGAFDLKVTCEFCSDGDHDGYFAIDQVDCPLSGDDCQDDNANVHPGVTDACGDQVDLDCDGFDCADFCVPLGSLQCGAQWTGDTAAEGSTPGFFDSYSCQSIKQSRGREATYTVTPDQDGRVTLAVQPESGFDAVLVLLKETGQGCVPDTCLQRSDRNGAGGIEYILADLVAGETYYLLVDGYGALDDPASQGSFQVSMACGDTCQDLDADGAAGFDPVLCPAGGDCCDSGQETDVPGCALETRAGIHSAMAEICGDEIDQNCDGRVPECPACAATLNLDCAAPASGHAASGVTTDVIDDYCDGIGAEHDLDWSGPETIFDLTPGEDTTVFFSVSNFGTAHLDLFALSDFGVDSVCNPNGCQMLSVNDSAVRELVFFARGGETSFISVDGRNGASAEFDYTMSCAVEACVSSEQQLTCGEPLQGDTSTGDNHVNAYPYFIWDMPGKELVYEFSVETDALVRITMTVDGSHDLALFILEDNDDGCLPGNVVAGSDLINQVAGPYEAVEFQAAGHAKYFVVVDAWTASNAGAFHLEANCDLNCGHLLQCGNACVDVDSDVEHCGGCQQPCDLDHVAQHACVGGQCAIVGCQTSFDDCNGLPLDGCEVNLSADPQNCSACDQACGGDDVCYQSGCVSECPAGMAPCQGTCLGTSTDPANCGSCGHVCGPYDNAQALCQDSQCQMGACQDDWSDCNDSNADGCETQLGTVTDCSKCGDDCSDDYSGAAGVCAGGICTMGSCLAGLADCNDAADDGCETQLGTDTSCRHCTDDCTGKFNHAQGTCNVDHCDIGACDTGWGDCDLLPVDGCESSLTSVEHCGACGKACAEGEGCVQGDEGPVCTPDCPDVDQDGFADSDCGGSDCNDQLATVNPQAEDVPYDGVDQDCTGADLTDVDGDNYDATQAGGTDCDDLDARVHPGAKELCGDGVDQDCVGGDLSCTCIDVDKDGFPDVACGGTDCDDNDPDVHPLAVEQCDQRDNNCNGTVDEEHACDLGQEGCGCTATDGDPSGLLGLLLLGWLFRRRF